ncbi:hypothetical protein [Streptomyces sp. ALB3]|uniref:hypothetical protein n=1 Tax=Streptomyces sp. ALB3 TaxID=3374278 RepID=UPI0037B3541F
MRRTDSPGTKMPKNSIIHPSENSPAPLYRSDRTFRTWRYGVGHSQLLLRAVPGSPEEDGLDLLFEGVDAMQLVSRYEALEIHPVSEEEFLSVYTKTGLDPKWQKEYIVVLLRSRTGEGYVQCQRITVERVGKGATQAEDSSAPRDLIWSLLTSCSED